MQPVVGAEETGDHRWGERTLKTGCCPVVGPFGLFLRCPFQWTFLGWRAPAQGPLGLLYRPWAES